MLERELKFHVPANKRVSLERELRKLNAAEQPLHACYFDTEKRELALAHIALRLRKEGDHWVQTVKMPGPDALTRIEINTPRLAPILDLSVYKGTPVERALGKLEYPLELRYETLVNRLVLTKKTRAGAIELAYDQGVVKAGGIELPLCELELELVSGNASHLFAQGKQWLKKYNLVLDLRSKSERGDALARLTGGTLKTSMAPPDFALMRKPRRAGAVTLEARQTIHAAYQSCANDGMNQIIRNATFLAGVDSSDASTDMRIEYVHQLRVGIRRLRSCWKFFSKWIAINEEELGGQLRQYFTLLGQARDRDVVELVVTPRLIQAGMPEVILPSAEKQAANYTQTLAASVEFQTTLLALLSHLVDAGAAAQPRDDTPIAPPEGPAARTLAQTERTAPPVIAGNLGKALSDQLNKRLNNICQQGLHFEQLEIETQHRLRKRVKGLRYSMEFSASVLSGKSFARLRDALAAAQNTLGDLNDLYVAHDYYQAIAADQPQALFAVGWLSAMQSQKRIEAQAEFTSLARAGRFKPA